MNRWRSGERRFLEWSGSVVRAPVLASLLRHFYSRETQSQKNIFLMRLKSVPKVTLLMRF